MRLLRFYFCVCGAPAGPLLIDSELSYCLDDFLNIHNTIHMLLPPPAASSTTATLVNARITDCHSRPAAIAPYSPSHDTTWDPKKQGRRAAGGGGLTFQFMNFQTLF